MKKIITLVLTVILILSLSLCFVSAEEETEPRELTVISHRSSSYVPEEVILNDFNLGADIVAVGVGVIDDELVLNTPGEMSSLRMLSDLIKELPEGKKLILDGVNESSDTVNSFVKKHKCKDSVIVRGKNIDSSLFDCDVIDVYSGGIVFSAMNKAKNSNGYIQFQSKNYFNPFYQKIVTNSFDKHNVTAIAPMYSPDLCGQRGDNNTGWDEMIDRGYNAIETGNIAALCEYRNALLYQRENLKNLYDESYNSVGESGEYIDVYSQTSYNNYRTALKDAKNSIDKLSSLASMQNSYSALVYAQSNLTLAAEKETVKGAWNITAGKVIACVLCAAGLIGLELFLKKKKGRIKIG